MDDLIRPPVLVLYLFLQTLGISKEHVQKHSYITQSVLYLAQHFGSSAIDYHFNWVSGWDGPLDHYWQDGFGDLHLPHYMNEVIQCWENIPQGLGEKQLTPFVARSLNDFSNRFEQATGYTISNYDEAGLLIRALAAFDYLQYISGYSHDESIKLFAKMKQHETFDVNQLTDILKKLEK